MPINFDTMTDAQHRVWAAFQALDWFSFATQWPEWAQEQAINLHKTDNKMYNFVYFLVDNGMSPEKAGYYALATDADLRTIGDERKYVILSDYPYGAAFSLLRWNRDGRNYKAKRIRDTARVVDKAERGVLLTDRKRVMDMTAGRPLGGRPKRKKH